MENLPLTGWEEGGEESKPPPSAGVGMVSFVGGGTAQREGIEQVPGAAGLGTAPAR